MASYRPPTSTASNVPCTNRARADSMDRYRALVRDRPERFRNPDGDIYEILLDEQQIDRARRDAHSQRCADGLAAEDTRVGVLAVDPYLVVMRDAVRFADGSYG